MTDPYTMEARLCDDQGLVSHEPVRCPDMLRPEWTYLRQLNHLRARTPNAAPYEGEPFACTGSTHLAGEHIRCVSPAHAVPLTAVPVFVLSVQDGGVLLDVREAQDALEFLRSMGYAGPTLASAVSCVVEQAMTNEAGRKRLAEALGADPNERWSALMIRVAELQRVRGIGPVRLEVLRRSYAAFLDAEREMGALSARTRRINLDLVSSAAWENARKDLSDALLEACPEILRALDPDLAATWQGESTYQG